MTNIMVESLIGTKKFREYKKLHCKQCKKQYSKKERDCFICEAING